ARAEDLLNLAEPHGDDNVAGRSAEPHQVVVTRQWARLDGAVLDQTTHVCCGNALRKTFHTEQPSRQSDTCGEIRIGVAVGRAEYDGIEPRPPEERLTPIAGGPEVHIVARSTEHDVAVGRTAGCRSAVRPTEDDVRTLTAIDHIVAVQSEDHVIARPAFENVGAVERLVCCRTRLNIRVVNPVLVLSNQQLSLLATFLATLLRGIG